MVVVVVAHWPQGVQISEYVDDDDILLVFEAVLSKGCAKQDKGREGEKEHFLIFTLQLLCLSVSVGCAFDFSEGVVVKVIWSTLIKIKESAPEYLFQFTWNISNISQQSNSLNMSFEFLGRIWRTALILEQMITFEEEPRRKWEDVNIKFHTIWRRKKGIIDHNWRTALIGKNNHVWRRRTNDHIWRTALIGRWSEASP